MTRDCRPVWPRNCKRGKFWSVAAYALRATEGKTGWQKRQGTPRGKLRGTAVGRKIALVTTKAATSFDWFKSASTRLSVTGQWAGRDREWENDVPEDIARALEELLEGKKMRPGIIRCLITVIAEKNFTNKSLPYFFSKWSCRYSFLSVILMGSLFFFGGGAPFFPAPSFFI